MLAMIYLLLGVIPALAAGPLAGLVYISLLKRKDLRYQILFWASLVALNLLLMYWVATSSGKWTSISSVSAFFSTPVASIITVFVMRRAWRKLEPQGTTDAALNRGFMIGCVLIPALQTGIFLALIFFGPHFCKMGWLVC
jgi:glucose-6-phosphate-specific signal transduction histidine kinase